jgi:orotate phosphoribosyltransferase
LAYEIFRPLIYIRKESKGYGVNNLIEGKLQENQNVLLIDDVITTGQSLKHAIKIIRNNGAKVNNVLTILFRGNNEIIDKYSQIDIDLKFLTTMTEISDILYSRNLIDREKREELKK